jgi:3-phytase
MRSGLLALLVSASGVLPVSAAVSTTPERAAVVKPRVVSAPVRHDTDDPAIWVDPADPARTLIVGTDKDIDGALYVFGLDGRVRELGVFGVQGGLAAHAVAGDRGWLE